MNLMKAYVLIKCRNRKQAAIKKELQKMRNVKEINRLQGDYDFLIKVTGHGIKTLRMTITHKIRRLDGIKSTYTMGPIKKAKK